MKLHLEGHVHNSPERIIKWYYSWPLGASESKVRKAIDGFSKSFTLVTLEITE